MNSLQPFPVESLTLIHNLDLCDESITSEKKIKQPKKLLIFDGVNNSSVNPTEIKYLEEIPSKPKKKVDFDETPRFKMNPQINKPNVNDEEDQQQYEEDE